MLQLLLSSGTVLKIDDLAAAFSIGKRTVSRDLDVLERWLSLKGGLLERKPNSGIKVLTFGKDPETLLEQLYTPESYLETLSPDLRQKLTLLYLIFNNREIKISEIANTFFTSDTTVWNDLNQIEKGFSHPSFFLERSKGVGLHLTGEESALRLEFLRIFSGLFSSRTIIPLFYPTENEIPRSLETNQFKLIMSRLKLDIRNDSILDLIHSASDRLGYSFTMSGETLLFFYLQITVHRIKSGALIRKSEACTDSGFLEAAGHILDSLTERIFSGRLPEAETEFLGLFLKVLETGDDTSSLPGKIAVEMSEEAKSFSQFLIKSFGDIDKELYYLDDQMSFLFSRTVSTFITRLQFNIPYWYGDWGHLESGILHKEEKETVLRQELEERFGLKADERDLLTLLMYFQALMIRQQNRPEHKLRCLVSCFEGIGLAAYLQSRLNREFHELDVVEATAVYKIRQDYLDSNHIDLVLSTYPLDGITTPVISLSLPINSETLKMDISREVERLHQIKEKGSVQSVSAPDNEARKIDFTTLIGFIERFRFIRCGNGNDLDAVIETVSRDITDSKKNAKLLVKDFQAREALGALYFEEYGIRVIHCRSRAVKKPVAGVLSFDVGQAQKMIFLAAPSPCPDDERIILSEITVSFMENSGFRASVLGDDPGRVRRALMEIYKEFI